MFSDTYEKLVKEYFEGGNAQNIPNAPVLKSHLEAIKEVAKEIAEADKQEMAENR